MTRLEELEQFEDALDRFGPQMAGWPDEARLMGERLLAENVTARSRLAEARRLEGLLAEAAEVPPLDAAARGRLAMAVNRYRTASSDVASALLRPRAAFAATFGAVAALMIGAALAPVIPTAASALEPTDLVALSLADVTVLGEDL